MLNLALLLDDNAREVPGRTAVVFEDTEFSYAELNTTANPIAHAMVYLGIERGDRVTISC